MKGNGALLEALVKNTDAMGEWTIYESNWTFSHHMKVSNHR